MLLGTGTALSAQPNKKIISVTEDLDVPGVRRSTTQGMRQRLLCHDGLREESFLTGPPSLGTKAYDNDNASEEDKRIR